MAALLPSEPLLDVPGVAAPTADGKAPTVQAQGVGKGKQLRLTTGGGGKGVGKTLGPATAQSKGKKVQEVPTKIVHTDKGPVAVPLAVDVRLSVRFAEDGVYYPARIVERRKKWQPEDEFDYEYYVHWTSFNRRMDNWVNLEDMDLETLEREDEDDKEGKKGQKRKFEEEHDEEHADFDPAQLREHEEFTKVKNIQQIELGRFDMDTWYFSPFPAEYNDCKKLYFCEFSLMFFKQRSQMLRHLKKTTLCHPPGDEIYRKGNVSMFEVDGRKEKIYCQNLCYLAKLFLDHKTLYYDVDLFLFYILCEVDSRGAHLVGYFSKEKCSDEGYNLACILTLPPYQRKGYGKFLISMSYELSKIEGKVGTPERPLSDLGLVSYRGYWTRVILGILKDRQGGISIQELSDMTCIKPDDIISTLQHLNLIQYQKGQHVIFAAPHIIEMHLRHAGSAGLVVDSSSITWSPYNAERDYASVRT